MVPFPMTLFLRKLHFCVHILATDEQTNNQMDSIDAQRHSRCCEWHLNNATHSAFAL